MADKESQEKTRNSQELFQRAKKLIPGGVNSPVRSFQAVGLEPRFISSGSGALLRDVDQNTYIDYVCSWGPLIFGHADPDVVKAVQAAASQGLGFGAASEIEVRMAECLSRLTGVEKVRLVNSGTEAVMSALRLARAFTGRDQVLKFAGCYHGHSDAMLVRAGSGALTGGIPDSQGVTPAVASSTLVAEYNHLDSVEELFQLYPASIAAVIVEPVAANMGLVPPAPGFLAGLREITRRYGALLIFDEVITGFRLALGGAQAYYDIPADLVTYGKIIGGGLPVGAYAGRAEIMRLVAPEGPVYQAGTLSGNPVALAAGLTQLEKLAQDPGIYPRLASRTEKLAQGLAEAAQAGGWQVQVNQLSSLACLYFTPTPVVDYSSAMSADRQSYAAYFAAMLERGVYFAPSQFEAIFVSDAHQDAVITATLAAATEFFSQPH
jgi:glutamate-1-semialdehyde 2,1-aminomutase